MSLVILIAGLTLFYLPAYAEIDPYWIFLKDKGITKGELPTVLKQVEANLTKESRNRRLNRGVAPIVTERDIPVNQSYVKAIAQITGVSIRMTSRWLNAIAVNADESSIERLKQLGMVERIEPIRARISHDELEKVEKPVEQLPQRDNNLNYGSSLRQNQFLNAPAIHEMGYLGRGVIVGICDAGFDNLDHECFSDLNVMAAWDFLNNDGEVGDQDDLGEGSHGTRCLSIIGGMAPGHLIGLAPEATYVLAKTENSREEDPSEEDTWIAAVEWMDSLGVEIISSSLGYSNWYHYQDLDGRTAPITVAADQAAEVGIVVVNAMGNTGATRYPGSKMVAPADGFKVLSIGATNRDSTLAGFSSQGPTFDGRLKPDLVTYGSSITYASSNDDHAYGGGAGTSFATPAIAGLCALIIQYDPLVTVSELGDLLRESASRADSPDTLMGYGVPNGLSVIRQVRPEATRLFIDLHEGWNTVSMNLTAPPAMPFRDLFAGLVDRRHLNLVKDDDGRFYSPDANFSNIPFWYPLGGYQVGVTEPDSLIFEGMLSLPNKELQLNQGWQIVAYLPNASMPTRDALKSLTEHDALIFCKDDMGKFFIPEFNFCNLPAMSPGRGYHIKLSADAILRYPRSRVGSLGQMDAPQPSHFVQPKPAMSGMSMLVYASQIIDGIEIGAFDDSNRLLGSGLFKDGAVGVALWDGKEGAEVSLRLYSDSDGESIVTQTTLLRGCLLYETDGITVLAIDQELMPEKTGLDVSLTPNPFNGETIVSILQARSGKVGVEVFDVLGKLVNSGSVVIDRQQAVVPIKLNHVGSGIYLFRITAGGESRWVRGVLIR